jgi:hypothetical protein
MEEEKLGCFECDCEEYEVQEQRKEKQPGHFYLTITSRKCKKCGKTYRVADNGVAEYYYN